MTTTTDVKTFEPDRTRSPVLGLAGTWLVLVLVSGVPVVLMREEIPVVAVAINLTLVSLVGLYCLLLALGWRSMRYDVVDDELRLVFRPLFTYRVPLAEIESVERVDVGESLFASHSWKGLVVRGVRYPGLGKVRMCATRSEGVVLIRLAEGRLYGVTPAQEGAFVAAVTGGRG